MKKTVALLLAVLLALFGLRAGLAEALIESMEIPDLWKEELHQAVALGLPLEKLGQQTLSGAEMMNLLDVMVGIAAPGRVDEWRETYPGLRAWEKPLTRFDAMAMLYLAGQFAGGAWAQPQDEADNGAFDELGFPWDESYLSEGLFDGVDGSHFGMPGREDDNYLDYVTLYYNLCRTSPFSGEFPFALDREANSIREHDAPTYAEGVLAVTRLIAVCTADAGTPDERILTPELIAAANAREEVSAQDHPYWTGFILLAADSFDQASVSNLNHIADWGFNSVRLNLHYRLFFQDGDVYTPRLEQFRKLDEIVAAAIKRDIHLDLCFCWLPGRERTIDENYQNWGEFDLFTNPGQQARADEVFRVFAARYRNVPGRSLSFSPLWESSNPNMSTGLPAPEYTVEDVCAYYSHAIDVIRAESPQRLIICEPSTELTDPEGAAAWAEASPVITDRGNTIISYNFCETAYAYAYGTAAEGADIDDQVHSCVATEYPTYVYGGNEEISQDMPKCFTGFMPVGTRFDIYIKSSTGDTLHVNLFEEPYGNTMQTVLDVPLEAAEYQSDLPRFDQYRFARSEKCISYTLDREAGMVQFRTDGKGLNWSGIEVVFPEKYAVDKWYHLTGYDVWLGEESQTGMVRRSTNSIQVSPHDYAGNDFILQADMTFVCEDAALDCADAQRTAEMGDSLSAYDGECIIRYESIGGTTWRSLKLYYDDILSMFAAHGFSWWSNDFELMTEKFKMNDSLAEAPMISYDGFEAFNLELLQLLQKYRDPAS